MNDIKKEDLIEGEFYRTFNHQIEMNIYFKYLKHTNPHGNISYSNLITNYLNSFYKKGFHNVQQYPFYEATSQEKHWLETCIKEDKFISFEEAMETFEEQFVLPKKWCIKSNSNKELQRVLKFQPIKNCHDTTSLSYYRHFPLFAQNCTCNNGVKRGYTEITFEQFNKYVLKETEEVKVIEPLPQFKVIKTTKNIETIIEVENNEGNLFMIGDTITTYNGINKGNQFIIKGFRYNNSGDNICAITDCHTPYSIGIDKIEHFITKQIPVVKETVLDEWLRKTKDLNLTLMELRSFVDKNVTCNFDSIFVKLDGYNSAEKADNLFVKWNPINESLLDKAKKLYPVGTKYKSIMGSSEYKSTGKLNKSIYGIIDANQCHVLMDGVWAEIIN